MNPAIATQKTPAVFPIQTYWPLRDWPDQLEQIPWGLIQRHEAQALKNHCGQTLLRLAERQGLDAMEMVAVLEDKDYIERWKWAEKSGETRQKQLAAIRILREHVERFLSEHATDSDSGSEYPQIPLGEDKEGVKEQ